MMTVRGWGLREVMRLADERIAPDARVLDVGCGYGQVSRYLAYPRSRGREVVGVDSSLDRIRAAQRLPTLPNLHFLHCRASDAFGLLGGTWDAIVCVDTLLYLTPAEQTALLTEAREHASENALLLVKDSTTVPRWKYRYTQFEERLKLAVGYYGRQMDGLTLTYRSPEEWERLFSETGWELEERRIVGKRSPYPGWMGTYRATMFPTRARAGSVS